MGTSRLLEQPLVRVVQLPIIKDVLDSCNSKKRHYTEPELPRKDESSAIKCENGHLNTIQACRTIQQALMGFRCHKKVNTVSRRRREAKREQGRLATDRDACPPLPRLPTNTASHLDYPSLPVGGWVSSRLSKAIRLASFFALGKRQKGKASGKNRYASRASR